MANKLVESGVARVEKIGGFIEKTVGKVLGSERLQERGQSLLDRADALRNGDDDDDSQQAPPAAKGKAKAREARAKKAEAKPQGEQSVSAAAQTSQEPAGGHPPSWQNKTKTPRRQYAL